MKGRGKVKGILIEGDDGHEYLLGFGLADRVFRAALEAFPPIPTWPTWSS